MRSFSPLSLDAPAFSAVQVFNKRGKRWCSRIKRRDGKFNGKGSSECMLLCGENGKLIGTVQNMSIL